MQYKLFTFALAALFASSSGAFAITATEKAINLHLSPKTIQTATAQEVLTAAKATLSDTGFTAKTSSVVSTALPYCASLAPDLVENALIHIVSDTTDFDPNILKLRKAGEVQVAAIVKAGMTLVLGGSAKEKNGVVTKGTASIFPTGAMDKSDGAAALTSRAVNRVKNAGDTSLLNVVVATAVKTAQTKGVGLENGAAGAVTGAISQVAGSGNTSIVLHTNGTDATADILVGNVITAAAKAAPKRINDIALAVGYAFAGTYRVTTPDGQISATAFLAASQVGLAAAIEAANPKTAAKLHATILQQISSGIALAYAGFQGPGAGGVNQFAYNNGMGSPVTDVSGL